MASEVGVDLARQFVSRKEMSKDEREEAVEKSREAVKGYKNAAHFLVDESRKINLRTLIIVWRYEIYEPYVPLYGVERWGEDGLLLRWEEDLLRAEEEEEGSLERCMQAIGSLCRTSLHELHLLHLPISPKHLNCLSQAMHQSPATISTQAHELNYNIIDAATTTSPGYTLQCLRLWCLSKPNEVIGEKVHACVSLPPSLLFLQFDEDDVAYKPPIQLAMAMNINRSAVSAVEVVGVIQVEEEGEVALQGSSNYTLPSLLHCPHLNQLQGLDIFSSRIDSEDRQLIRGDGELRNAALSLADNKSLKALRIGVCGEPLLPEEFATQVLSKRNTTLTTLDLRYFRMPGPLGFDHFFEEGVATNRTLTHLSLRGCEGPWSVEAILDSLEDNGSLHSIDLRRTPLEGNAAIKAQTQRNAKRVEMMRSLGVNPSKVPPTACRVFLCGEPFAGTCYNFTQN